MDTFPVQIDRVDNADGTPKMPWEFVPKDYVTRDGRKATVQGPCEHGWFGQIAGNSRSTVWWHSGRRWIASHLDEGEPNADDIVGLWEA